MKDAEISPILEGTLSNPISSIVIKHNHLGDLSLKVLQKYLEKKEIDGKDVAHCTSLKFLEINDCNMKPSKLREFTSIIKANRNLEELHISSMELDRASAKNISDFVNNNFKLRKLNISWCEFKSADLMQFIEDIKNVKHLQYLDISAIPIEGPK